MWIRTGDTTIPHSVFNVNEKMSQYLADGGKLVLEDGSKFHPQNLITMNVPDTDELFESQKRPDIVATQVLQYMSEKTIADKEEYQRSACMSVLTQRAFDIMHSVCKSKGVVSIGAGSGFIEYLLQEEGIEVAAFDTQETLADTSYNPEWCIQPWSDIVQYGNESSAKRYSLRVLLLAWPECGSSMGLEALCNHQGDTVIYIGEECCGAAGDQLFFEYLASYFTVVMHTPLKSFYGSVDSMWILKRTNNKKHSVIGILSTTQWTILIDQQQVGAYARREKLAIDPESALIQLRTGGFISWLTMIGIKFEDVVDTVRKYGRGDITEKLKYHRNFGTSMIHLLRDIRLNR